MPILVQCLEVFWVGQLLTICGPQAALVISGIPALIGWVMMANAALIVNNYNMFFGVLLAGRMIFWICLWTVYFLCLCKR